MFRLYSPPVSHLPFIDPKRKTAFRVRANPRLERHRSAILTVVRKWNQRPIVALLAFRQLHLRTSFQQLIKQEEPHE